MKCGSILGLILFSAGALSVRASEELTGYLSYSVPVKKSLVEAQADLVGGFDLCKPYGWVVDCKPKEEGTAICVVSASDRVKGVGKVEFIALGQQTQVVASILKSYPVPTQELAVRQWLHYAQGRAKDVCPSKR